MGARGLEATVSACEAANVSGLVSERAPAIAGVVDVGQHVIETLVALDMRVDLAFGHRGPAAEAILVLHLNGHDVLNSVRHSNDYSVGFRQFASGTVEESWKM